MKFLLQALLVPAFLLFDCNSKLLQCDGANEPQPLPVGANDPRDSALILQSSDGGATWYDPYIIDEAVELHSVSSLGGGGYNFVVGGTDTAGSAIILTTHDAGFQWNRTYTGGYGSIQDIKSTLLNLVAVGGFSVLKSDDFGDSWVEVAEAPNLKAVSFYDALGFAIGSGGDLLKSTDYGGSWVSLPDPGPGSYFTDIVNQGNAGVIAVGYDNVSFPMYLSFDAGISWQAADFCGGSAGIWGLESVAYISPTEAVVADYDDTDTISHLWHTSNSGLTWCVNHDVGGVFSYSAWRDILSAEDHILIVGDRDIWRSTNHGMDWEMTYFNDSGKTGYEFNAVYFPSFPDGYGIAVGSLRVNVGSASE